MSEEIKQVIVIRKDLRMRRGKEIAQGSHASISFLVECVKNGISPTSTELAWINGLFTKICLQCKNLDELLEIYHSSLNADIKSYIITDCGLTEFDGVPTQTCVALGPDWASKIDPITNHLRLY